MMNTLTATPRPRRAYDHRLREQVIRSGARCLPKHVAIPRSTVSTWTRRGLRPLVSIEPLKQDRQQLLDSLTKLDWKRSCIPAVSRPRSARSTSRRGGNEIGAFRRKTAALSAIADPRNCVIVSTVEGSRASGKPSGIFEVAGDERGSTRTVPARASPDGVCAQLLALDNADLTEPMDMDYDDLWRSGSDYLCRWDGLSNPRLATLADYTAATGQEGHGLSQDPGFVAPATPDFTPAPGSPLIDRELVIPGINDAFRGTGPDLGAIEAP